MAIRWPLLVRRVHKWLALFVGIQAVIWTATGMYMVAVHINIIHGDHLVRPAPRGPVTLAGLVTPGSIVAADPAAREVRLQRLLDRPVWRVDSKDGAYAVDARTGQRVPKITEAEAREIARRIYTGEPEIVSARLLNEAPLEMQTRKPPYWRVQFKGWNEPTLYISPATGELISRRHNLWRIFDFVWMLHIMDYEARSNINNPLLRFSTSMGLIFAVSGLWLVYFSFRRRRARPTK